MDKRKIIDLCVIGFFVVLGAFVTIYFKTGVSISTIIYYLLPAIYLLFVGKYPYKKIFFTTFLWTIVFGILDFVSYANNAWWVPTDGLIIKWRLLFGSPALEWVYFFVFILFVLLFYEHFVDHRETKKISKNFKGAILILILTTFIFFFLAFSGLITEIKYPYLIVWGLYILPPIVYLLFKKIKFVKKLFLVWLPFSVINLVYELTAVPLKQWVFSGQYIGEVILFGVKFPFEEFFFFIMLASLTVVSYYELFFDDMK